MTSISKGEIIEALSLEGDEQKSLHAGACTLRDATISNDLYFRGLIEISNICVNDCLYCGIRTSNKKLKHFELTRDEIVCCVDCAVERSLSSVVLQSGERPGFRYADDMAGVVAQIKKAHPAVSMTLSFGELSRDQYQKLYEAGAERYLLRIETSDEKHYQRLHPEEMSFKKRLQCLENLREIGYQVGSGVMIHSPFQTLGNLADDILFLKNLDIDMCGMGPYIPHEESPLAHLPYDSDKALSLGLNMIAMLRTAMPDINIAATTALETLSFQGKELGLKAGANVIMPQFSPPEKRRDYMLYDNKPAAFENYDDLIKQLVEAGRACGMTPNLKDPGHSLHYRKRMNYGNTC